MKRSRRITSRKEGGNTTKKWRTIKKWWYNIWTIWASTSPQKNELQIAANAHVSPTRGMTTARKQKRPRTKIAQYKGLKINIGSGKDAEISDGRRKQEGGVTKIVNISTKHYHFFKTICIRAMCIHEFLMHVLFASASSHSDWKTTTALYILDRGYYGSNGLWSMWGVKFDYTRKCDKHGRGNGAWNSNLRRMCFYGGVQKRRRRIYPLQKCGNGWPTYAEDWRSCEKLHIMTY